MSQSAKVWFDINFIQSTKGAGEVLTHLEKSNVPTIIEKLPIENSIFWTRNSSVISSSKLDQNNETQHDHIVVKLELDSFTKYLLEFNQVDEKSDSSLAKLVQSIKKKAQVTQVTLLVPGLKAYLKGLKFTFAEMKAQEEYNDLIKKKSSSKSKPSVTKSDANRAIIYLELNENVCMRSFDSSEELRDLVLSYSKAVAEYLSKQDHGENVIFCDKSVEKSQTKVSKEGAGLINLWKDILESFNLVSSDQAQAICAIYPSPLLLKKAYEAADRTNSGPLLLADIEVRRGAGVLSSVRRIGPELSKKVHKFFTTHNLNELLVND